MERFERLNALYIQAKAVAAEHPDRSVVQIEEGYAVFQDIKAFHFFPIDADKIMIQTEDNVTIASKSKLCQYSTVFAAMFANDMSEKQTSVVHISDFRPSVIQHMTNLIECREFILPPEDLPGLLQFYDKYNIIYYRSVFENLLADCSLDIGNTHDVLEFAQMTNSQTLLGRVLEFVNQVAQWHS
ncbi:unnamed protein product [Orchesella dallaii]|uniref:BTB domain-containing protein n=1 Tax=Orchesella dallaii TaxID=48710 RepID=A0ABP1QME5_9HEXA